uniref:Uncharacterized protein n=1 Tax=Rhizophora mucronata TaxID=61149 RepID=A0A2P2QRW4_RHIMU
MRLPSILFIQEFKFLSLNIQFRDLFMHQEI